MTCCLQTALRLVLCTCVFVAAPESSLFLTHTYMANSRLCVICAVGAVGYQGQQGQSQGFNVGSGMMGFGAGAVAGAALGELTRIHLSSTNWCCM